MNDKIIPKSPDVHDYTQDSAYRAQADANVAPIFDADDPLGFLTNSGDASSVPNSAYRYCRHTPGVDVVLTGTGKIEHLKQNVASILEPPLSAASLERLDTLFGKVASVSGN